MVWIQKKDFVVATVLSAFLFLLFCYLSSGYELIVTFALGIVFAYSIFITLYRRKIECIEPLQILPLYFGVLAWQFIHFSEEFSTGFSTRFPLIYGGEPYTAQFFVVLNMISYSCFALAAIFAFVRRKPVLLIPVLFFTAYGALGNAIAHTTWSLYFGEYFPGLYTAQLYWLLAPLLLRRLTGDWKVTLFLIIPYVILLPIALIAALV
ncbi:hypothetical protein M3661_20365 [Paenibacillus sp. MER 180]|uniref:hypothetical protein n=1 Tax=Paenibacillus sp. MER 180 TaxID=2939570 RepID=UPI00203DD88B|nr:hypothetical protein [Paenibacillus sp. MER 180]MCM3292477.1 hypothetical protein [Paenibacillus sp. MER 180]